MLQDARPTSPFTIAVLIALNLVPLAGVLNWGWQSFDLIFLYWMENVVIGVFALARMVVRPYSHLLELFFPLFLAPFFALHYGGFCWGHGTFVVGLFGPDNMNGFALLPAVLGVLASPTMLFALGALTLIQVMDWVRDVRHRGFGADTVKDLMVKPYRRIVVLHVSIIAGGFALEALQEPVMGLVILVVVKTLSDIWHWRKDAQAEATGEDEAFDLDDEMLEKLAAEYPRPVVTVNGKEREFASFQELKDSKEFRMAMTVMRMMGGGKHLKALNTYMNMRIEEESRAHA